jgi:tetratricopeptide (TPR) repeat protein
MTNKCREGKESGQRNIFKAISSLGLGWILSIFFTALAYRTLCYSVLGDNPLFLHPVVDAGQHLHWAERIVAGDLLGHGPDDVFKPPLYPYFLAAWFSTFGRSIPIIQWVQYLLGALSSVLLAIWVDRLLGRSVAILSGFFSALYAPFVFYESQLLTPTLSIFLNQAFLIVLLPQDEAPSARRWLAGGMLLGLSAGMRPDVLLPGGLVGLFLLWHYHTASWLYTIRWATCLGIGLFLIILPITWRNAMLTGEFIPIASYSGINFYTGNGAKADGFSAVPVGLRWERLVSQVPQAILERPAEASRWWMERTWEEMAATPGQALARFGKKALAFGSSREFRNNICYHFIQAQAWILRLPFLQFSVIFPLALCGVVSLCRSPLTHARFTFTLVLIWVLGYGVTGILFFISDRYRLPAIPLLMMAGGFALVKVTANLRGHRWGALGLQAAVFLVAGLISWPMWFGRPQLDWTRDYINLGNAWLNAGDAIRAEQTFRKALTVYDDPDAHYLLAKILLNHQRTLEALLHLEAARRAIPDSPDVLLLSAKAYLDSQHPVIARQLLHQFLDIATTSNLWPRRKEWALAHLILSDLEASRAVEHRARAWTIHPPTAAEFFFLRRQEMARVLETFRSEAKDKPWDWYAQANYGLSLLENGYAGHALAQLRRAAELAPDKEGLRFELARALAYTGKKDEALAILAKLLQTLPECPLRMKVKSLQAQLRATDP